jgi:hypothetical protein
MGTAYHRVGFVQFNAYSRPHLGDHDGAVASQRKAIELLAPLAATNPEAAFQYGQAMSALANIDAYDGHLDAALQRYDQVLVLYRDAARLDRPDLRNHLEWARTHLRRADEMYREWREHGKGSAAAIEAEVARGDAVLDEMQRRQPHHPELPHVRVWVHNLLSNIAQLQGRWAEQLRHDSESLALLLPLQEAAPDNAEFRQDIAGQLAGISQAALWLGDHARALDHAQRALQQREWLYRLDPDNLIALRDLRRSLLLLGTVEVALHDCDAARPHLQQSAAVTARLLQREPAAAAHPSSALEGDIALARCEGDGDAKRGWSALQALQPAAAALARRFPANAEAQTQAMLVRYQAAAYAHQLALAQRLPAAQAASAAQEAQALLRDLQARRLLRPPAHAAKIDTVDRMLADLSRRGSSR